MKIAYCKPDLSAWGEPITHQSPSPSKPQPQETDIPEVTAPVPSTFTDPERVRDAQELSEEQRRLRDIIAISGGPEALYRKIQKMKCEDSLAQFSRQAWSSLETVPLVHNWHIDAICDHLQAVTQGHIRRLIINVPPRTLKSNLVSVLYPAWTWIQEQDDSMPLSGSHVRFLFASYSQFLSERDSVRTRRLIESGWYQNNWADRYKLVGDQNTKRRFETDKGGYRLATSVGGTLTGEGGDIIVCDDPISAQEANSEVVRDTTNQWWDEVMSTRLNDPKRGAFIVIMQRLHEDDTTGHILQKFANEYTHLMLPMRHDLNRHCVTFVGGLPFFEDPRKADGELLFPARFSDKAVRNLEEELGPYGTSGQLQQSPSPRGGGIIKREWWQPWPPLGQDELWLKDLPDTRGIVAPRVTYPDFDFIVASLDTAYTEKDENDYSACTVWGVFEDPNPEAKPKGMPKIMLIHAWRARLTLNALVERILQTTRRLNLQVDSVLIENKASGHSVAQELKRLMRPGEFSLHLLDPRRDGGGDKVARMYAAQPTFASLLVHAPQLRDLNGSWNWTTWAEGVISEVEQFPKSKYKDWADSTSQAINWLRKRGLARMQFEHEEDIRPRAWTGNQGGIAERDYGV